MKRLNLDSDEFSFGRALFSFHKSYFIPTVLYRLLSKKFHTNLLLKMSSPGMRRRIDLIRTDISKEHFASIVTVKIQQNFSWSLSPLHIERRAN
jgi:hypothetical protein